MRAEPGAYGFRIVGVDGGYALAVRGAGSWPILRVETLIEADPGPPGARVTECDASIQTPAAHLVVDRASSRVSVRSRTPVPDADLVHPCLWPAAAVFARWHGAETLHGGAFLDAAGGAWVVLGDRGAGKSSLLASLALAGHHVVADDLVVLDGSDCYAGPRCVDLRPETVACLRISRITSPVRSTQRRRLALEPSDGRLRVHGFVHLAWGERITIDSVAPAEHLGLLARHRRVVVLGANLDQLFELAGMPALRLVRPRALNALVEAQDALVSAVSSHA